MRRVATSPSPISRRCGRPASTACITPDDMVAELEAQGPFGFAMFHPMCGGVPPDLAWRMLKLFETDVLPRVPA